MKEKKTNQLFENRFLESLTKVKMPVAVTFHLCLIFGVLAIGWNLGFLSSAVDVIIYLFFGLLVWTFFEYILHRFLFHPLFESKVLEKISYTLHGIHHDFPRDTERTFMPPVPALLFLTAFFLFFYIFLRADTFAFLPGFELGYLCYAFIHYSIHTFTPPNRLKFIWKHHANHHYQDEDRGFGVSTPIWDIIFGTMPKKK